jgi:hypothetical protein
MANAQHLFIVRIWLEQSNGQPPDQWRGSVEHIPSARRFYFTALSDLLDFIKRWLDDPALQ